MSESQRSEQQPLMQQDTSQMTRIEDIQKYGNPDADAFAHGICELDARGATKVMLLSIVMTYAAECDKVGKLETACQRLEVWYRVMAAFVPILIPFSQTYKDTEMSCWGFHVNLGAVISVSAIACSICGTVIYTYMGASQIKGDAIRIGRRIDQTQTELWLFLSAAGSYADPDLSIDKKYAILMERYTIIMEQTSPTILLQASYASDKDKDKGANKKEGEP